MSTSTTKTSTTTRGKDTRLTDSLNLVLADSYALMGLTHFAHWNVEGSDFFALHTAFQSQYENLFTAIDEIAERVRALDAFAIGGLRTLAQTAGIDELKVPMPQKDYVAALIVAHEKSIDDIVQTRDLAGQMNDLQTQDLMIGRLQWHEKTVWMLKSYLKS
jgi:starvation-inducible DNA-binding protein